MAMTVSSTAFRNNGPIPKQYTGDGKDVSPPLGWSGAPAGTKELALICDDPDAPSPEPWVHWVIYKLPAGTNSLAEGVHPSQPIGAVQGKNSWGTIGYRGPAPPKGHGVHHYHFKLYALDTMLAAPVGASKAELLKAMDGHILAEAEMVGTYQR